MRKFQRLLNKVSIWGLLCLWIAACGGDSQAPTASNSPQVQEATHDSPPMPEDRKFASINIGAAFKTLDPSLASDTASTAMILPFLRGLMIVDSNDQVQPELAESWTISDDGLVYTIQLREAYWTNGEPVTADDFVYAWTQRVLNPEVPCLYSYQLYNYVAGAREFYDDPSLGADSVGVHALAPDVLEITLKAPAPFFLELLAHHTFYPVCRSVVSENSNWSTSAETYVGNGPFIIEEIRSGDRIIGKRNPNYWNAENVALERLELRMIEKESTALIAYETGEVHGTKSIPQDEADSLRGRPDLQIRDILATYYLELNTEHSPINDVRVRRALAMAIDRNAICSLVLKMGQTPALFLSPQTLYDSPLDPVFPDADIEGARQLLAEAGYPGGEGFPELLYLYNTMDGHRKIAQVLQASWKQALGIDIRIENQEFKVVIDRREQGQYDIARAGWVADYSDPLNFLEMMTSDSENNHTRWGTQEYNALVNDIRATVDPTQRMTLLIKADRMLMEALPIIPLYYYTQSYMAHPHLKGYRLNHQGNFDAAALRWE